jgi:hypothetical protein
MDLNRKRRVFCFLFLLSRRIHEWYSYAATKHSTTEGEGSESRLGVETQRKEPKNDAFFCCVFSLRLAHSFFARCTFGL